jgi:hypothetical protein
MTALVDVVAAAAGAVDAIAIGATIATSAATAKRRLMVPSPKESLIDPHIGIDQYGSTGEDYSDAGRR